MPVELSGTSGFILIMGIPIIIILLFLILITMYRKK